jgi:hypothetical protein
MIVYSANVRFGGRNVARRAAQIVSELRSEASFGTALLLVQECSAASMRAISELLRETHVGFARPGHESVVGIFVATFVPRGLLGALGASSGPNGASGSGHHGTHGPHGPNGPSVTVTCARTPHTRMGRDFHAVRFGDTTLLNVHLDSCSESAATRWKQIQAMMPLSRRLAVLGDLNGPEKYAARGVDVAVRTIWMPRKLTDHSVRVYTLR